MRTSKENMKLRKSIILRYKFHANRNLIPFTAVSQTS